MSMNTTMGPTTVSLESPLDKNPPVAADSATGQMLRKQEFMVKYYAKAQRYLDDRDRLRDATDDQITSVAEWLRYHEFRRAVEPLDRYRNKAVSDWLAIQTDVHAEQPEWLKKIVTEWNEHIAFVARSEFGYESTSGAEHGD